MSSSHGDALKLPSPQVDEIIPWGCLEIIKSTNERVHYLVQMDEFIIKSIGGQVHQSRRVHPSYLPSLLRDNYILTYMHKDGRTYAYLKVKINT